MNPHPPLIHSLFAEPFLSPGWRRIGLCGILLLCGSASWLFSFGIHREDPFDVHVLYRHPMGDLQYFPAIVSLSRLHVGEAMLYESVGKGVMSFPFASLAPHAFFVALFGPAGFLVADLVIVFLYFCLLRALLRVLGISPAVANGATLFLVSGAHRLLNEIVTHLLFDRQILYLWGWRIPRPFVTEVYLLATLLPIAMIWLVPEAASKRRYAIAAGVGLALLLQGDLHFSLLLGTAFLIGMLCGFFRDPQTRRQTLHLAYWGGVAFLVTAIPFFLQRLGENPDLPLRMGVFPIIRFPPPFSMRGIGRVFLTLLALAVTCQFLPRRGRESFRLFTFLATLAVASLLALPVSGMMLGQGVQLHHFPDRLGVITSYIFFCSLTLGVDAWLQDRKPMVRSMLGGVLLLFTLGGIVSEAVERTRYSGHLWAIFPEWRNLPDYRRHFADLIRELRREDYANCQVLGTFDHQLMVWWVAFRGGFSFLADPVFSLASTREIETRFAAFCQMLALSPAACLERVMRIDMQKLWLHHHGYEQHPWRRRPSPLLSSEERERILCADPFYPPLLIPIEEQRRLLTLYETTAYAPRYRLDLVVLPRRDNLSPSSPSWRMTFENAMFRVWKYEEVSTRKR